MSVAVDLDCIGIATIQKALEGVGHGMPAKIRGHIADPESPVRISDPAHDVAAPGRMGRGSGPTADARRTTPAG